jgi:hypothetical protein
MKDGSRDIQHDSDVRWDSAYVSVRVASEEFKAGFDPRRRRRDSFSGRSLEDTGCLVTGATFCCAFVTDFPLPAPFEGFEFGAMLFQISQGSVQELKNFCKISVNTDMSFLFISIKICRDDDAVTKKLSKSYKTHESIYKLYTRFI